jgi:hypothetical protein
MEKVSLVTVSNYKRLDFFKIIIDCVKHQNYKNIIEWVIVYGNKDGFKKFKKFINSIDIGIKIVVIDGGDGKIGKYRNMYNKVVKGDVIVCMDDDDYYKENYVEECVKSVKEFKMACIPNIILYDLDTDICINMNKIASTIFSNNALAYKREMCSQKYDEEVNNLEEQSFSNNFSIQCNNMDPSIMVHLAHYSNTFNKRNLILNNTSVFRDRNIKNSSRLDIKLEELIPENFAKRYREIAEKQKKISEYNIIYYLGESPEWCPTEQNLGGSEQAVKYLSELWVKKGLKVAVYGTFKNNIEIHNGVNYYNYQTFKFLDEYNIVILWRLHGLEIINLNINCKKLYVDLHDNIQSAYRIIQIYQDKIYKVFFKSNFHYEEMCNSTGILFPSSKSVIIPNGIRVEEFTPNGNHNRDNYRLCYCSCYTRGLQQLLEYLWPVLKKLEPKAELHVYYGMEYVRDENFKNHMLKLLQQPGVMDHGKQNVDMISREKQRSNFHLYFTDNLLEIDCISIRESLVAGAIPILSNSNLFSERDGIRFDENPKLQSSYHQLAQLIYNLMQQPQQLDLIRQHLKKSKTIFDWEYVSNIWITHF